MCVYRHLYMYVWVFEEFSSFLDAINISFGVKVLLVLFLVRATLATVATAMHSKGFSCQMQCDWLPHRYMHRLSIQRRNQLNANAKSKPKRNETTSRLEESPKKKQLHSIQGRTHTHTHTRISKSGWFMCMWVSTTTVWLLIASNCNFQLQCKLHWHWQW